MVETPVQLADQGTQQVLPLIQHLARVARRAFDAFPPSKCLRPRHMIALSLLRERGPLSQQALGEALSLDPSNVVGLLNELEDRGHIARQRDPADRRRHIVTLSTAGEQELTATGTALTGIEDDLLKALSPAERTQLHDLLARVVRDASLPGEHSACAAPPGPCEAPPPC